MCLCDIPLPTDCVIVFDLDDTLYPERDFVQSGFREVARVLESTGSAGALERLQQLFADGDPDPFGTVIEQDGAAVQKSELLRVYREHEPTLRLADGIRQMLDGFTTADRPLGIITDGRSLTQRNKIHALGLEQWIHEIIISEEFGSEKPAPRNYRYFENTFPGRTYAYVGDNLEKDFLAPNQLGWTTVAVVDSGQNTHPQRFDKVPPENLPHFLIEQVG
jgi:putative hydrolase of the HAD superfamily